MDNFDVILLTVPLVFLFLLFGLATIKEFTKMSKNEYTGDGRNRGAASFLGFLGGIFSNTKPNS